MQRFGELLHREESDYSFFFFLVVGSVVQFIFWGTKVTLTTKRTGCWNLYLVQWRDTKSTSSFSTTITWPNAFNRTYKWWLSYAKGLNYTWQPSSMHKTRTMKYVTWTRSAVTPVLSCSDKPKDLQWKRSDSLKVLNKSQMWATSRGRLWLQRVRKKKTF